MKKLSEINTWEEVDTVIKGPEFEFVLGALLQGDMLIVGHREQIRIWNIKDLPSMSFVSSLELPSSFTSMKLVNDVLYLFGSSHDEGVQIVDISNIKEPVLLRKIMVENLINVHYTDEMMYATAGNNVVSILPNNAIDSIIDIPEKARFDDYPSDIYKIDETLFVVGRHSGLYIYSYSDSSNWELQSTHKVGYTPTTINWEKLGEKMILVGNSEVIRYDVTNYKKPKRYKACKVKSTELFGGYVERGNEILVAGNKGAKDKFSLGVVELADDEVKLVMQPKLKYKARVNFGEIVRAIFVKNNYMLIIGQETGCFLFKEEE